MGNRRNLLLPLLALGALLVAASPAMAGNGAPSGSHYSLNIIGVEKGKNPPMTNDNRHTIFVPLGANGEPARCKINLVNSLILGEYAVKDGNCFDDSVAAFSLPNPDANNDGTTDYSVFARGAGKPGGRADVTTCQSDSTPDSGGTEDCSDIYASIISVGGNREFSNVSKQLLYVYDDIDEDGTVERVPLFGTSGESYWWYYDNQGLRVAQLRFYECSTIVPAPTDPNGAQNDADCFA